MNHRLVKCIKLNGENIGGVNLFSKKTITGFREKFRLFLCTLSHVIIYVKYRFGSFFLSYCSDSQNFMTLRNDLNNFCNTGIFYKIFSHWNHLQNVFSTAIIFIVSLYLSALRNRLLNIKQKSNSAFFARKNVSRNINICNRK